ncbi:hypothetical protein ZWY2020_037148 [Hordeum vulgare]|nr:hypothetical protein ZWY2020_037148 [Hordeum vulgare]
MKEPSETNERLEELHVAQDEVKKCLPARAILRAPSIHPDPSLPPPPRRLCLVRCASTVNPSPRQGSRRIDQDDRRRSPAPEDAIEECRKLCGGHGYLNSSGLPELFAFYVPGCTYEGDNVVLLLQVARFFMKTASQVATGNEPVSTVAYMGNIQHLMQCKSAINTAEDWLDPATVKEVFEARALRMAVNCAQNISKAPSQEEASLSEFVGALTDMDDLEAAVAHVQLIIVTKFIEKMQEDIPGPGVKEQLQKLCSIYALHLLHKHLAGERSTAHFDIHAMKVAWAGSRHAVEVADRMARLVASDPVPDVT